MVIKSENYKPYLYIFGSFNITNHIAPTNILVEGDSSDYSTDMVIHLSVKVSPTDEYEWAFTVGYAIYYLLEVP